MKNNALTFLVLLVVLALTACGGAAEPEQPVEERVLARWQHLIDRDFEAAWEYYAPGYRETSGQAAFTAQMARRPVRWQDVELLSLECSEDACDVNVRVRYRATGRVVSRGRVPAIDRTLQERWIRIDGQWWYAST